MTDKPDWKASNAKWFSSSFLAVVLLASGSFILGDDATLLRELKENPAGSPEAARWFANLPVEKKRAYSAKIGRIVLDSESGSGFVVAFGSAQSPYPWVFVVGKGRLDLTGDNSFSYVLRDDRLVKKQWGVYWFAEHNYDSKSTGRGIAFIKRPDGRKGSHSDLWIPASGWKYVGPQLPKSKSVLRARDLP
jgi:hypothetical protein